MSNKLTNVELSERARALGKISHDEAKAREERGVAFDAKTDAVDPTHYDAIHDSAVALLSGLAKAGHKRSHALLNPPTPVAQDSKLAASREALAAVGSIGL